MDKFYAKMQVSQHYYNYFKGEGFEKEQSWLI